MTKNSHPQTYIKSWVGLIVGQGLLLDAPFSARVGIVAAVQIDRDSARLTD
jgi:hypothetical protein